MARPIDDDPLWYKDAVVYQLHVKAFFDSNADGIGDFPGLTEKLDYLQDLGVTAIWLLPFYPSPLRDDGYDIADYTGVHPDYGTRAQFRRFLREAHRRGLRVITELVLNHTSDQHRWFQRARNAPAGSRARDFYVWSDTPDRYREARIIFKDFEASNWSWDPVAQAYYWHRFYSHQPDLNFENPEVREAMTRALDFWMDMGVDGMRLDAVPYLFEREGTNCENLPETHAVLKELRAHVDARHRSRMLLAEANQWPEDARAYFGDGDECHMAFHFPVMPRLFMALRMEDRFPIVDILQQTPEIPETCQWAVFLRNHDELTLEMVTDEERDYMYRVYAHDPRARINFGIRRRLAPLLGNDRRRIELMNGLLFSLPGTPILYYGDEIGMGDNIYLGDRNGVRTPMQWSPDRNAGFSRAPPQRLYFPVIIDAEYHYETVNVEAQHGNPHSLLWWTRRLIGLRKRFQAFGRGDLRFFRPDNHRVLVFLRTYRDERILVVANLSRFAQCAELDLAEFEGMVPVELFGRTRFPPIGRLPYFLTLGPHGFYWFALEPEAAQRPRPPESVPSIRAPGSWQQALRARGAADAFAEMLQRKRWFGGKARGVQGVQLVDAVPVPLDGPPGGCEVALLRVSYVEGEPETYVLPLAFATGEDAGRVVTELPQSVVARVEERGVIYEATSERAFTAALLETILRRRRHRGPAGEVAGVPTAACRRLQARSGDLTASILRAEQSNTSVAYGETFVAKLVRRMDEGPSPDLELGRFLTERTGFRHTPQVAGSIEYRGAAGTGTLAILQEFVPNQGDCWNYTLDSLGRFFERVLNGEDEVAAPAERVSAAALLDLAGHTPPEEAFRFVGTYLDMALLLGRRTGELHTALASDASDPAFAPERFSALYQRSVYQALRNLLGRVFRVLQRVLPSLPEDVRQRARSVAAREEEALERYRRVLGTAFDARRIRIHGDYHLGQVLVTGSDFSIIDFEGEPARPIGERRIKRSPMRDVAGMLRSFHYAVRSALDRQRELGALGPSREARAESLALAWQLRVGGAFLNAYFEAVEPAALLPPDRRERQILLDAFLLDKAVYELGYELNNRPDWVRIPLDGIAQLLGPEAQERT